MHSPIWSSDAYWQKARAYLARSAAAPTEPESLFWCAIGLELLARAALAKIHGGLLAEVSNNESEHLLFAFGGPLPKKGPRSIGVVQVLRRLRVLVPEFTEDHASQCSVFANARNEELHTGALPLEQLATANWRANFYRAIEPLLRHLGRSFKDFLGADEAKVARKLIKQADKIIASSVRKVVAGHRTLFDAKSQKERDALHAAAVQKAEAAALDGGHRVSCPACAGLATLRGQVLATAEPTLEDNMVVVRSTVVPSRFACSACGLTLKTTAALQVEDLAKPFTRTLRYPPLEYYAEAGDAFDYEEYDNE